MSDSGQPSSGGGQDPWERKVIEKVLLETVAEQRRARRWGLLFKGLLTVYLFAILALSLPSQWMSEGVGGRRHTALIEVEGLIASDTRASADNVIGALRAAFEDKHTAGIILRINSPGGSPVQAGYVNDEIHRLREKHPEVPVYAVITDVCASGGYYIAAAAQEIYADKASIVGSIGVLMDSFGFVGTLDKLGVERRLLTAGESKGFLDPFSPLKDNDVTHIQGVLDEVHQQFINTVRRGRGERLKEDESLFSGLIWTGEQSLELGLVDALGSSSFVAREVIGEERIVDFTAKEEVFERFARRLGATVADRLLSLPALR